MSSNNRLHPEKVALTDYGAVNHADRLDDFNSDDLSSTTATKRVPTPVWLVALGVTLTMALLFAFTVMSPSEPGLMSAELVQTGATTESSSSSGSLLQRSSDRDESLVHDLKDYALIHRLDQRSFYFHNVDKWPSVSLDLEVEHEKINGVSRESSILTVSWTNGKRGPEDRSILHDDDVVALRCGTSLGHLHVVDAELLSHIRDGHESKRRLQVERDSQTNAATLREPHGRRMSTWFDGRSSFGEWNVNKDEWVRERVSEKEWNGVNDNEWVLDPVPEDILVEPHCQAILCHMIEDLEYVVVAESDLIRFGHIH